MCARAILAKQCQQLSKVSHYFLRALHPPFVEASGNMESDPYPEIMKLMRYCQVAITGNPSDQPICPMQNSTSWFANQFEEPPHTPAIARTAADHHHTKTTRTSRRNL